MVPFTYHIAADVASAVALAGQHADAQFIAGGTSQVDLLKEDVQRPGRLVDVSRLPLTELHVLPGGGLRIGANVKNAVLATHPVVQSGYPAISEALLAGASQQVRNMASTAGNLLQRTRCPYLRDPNARCNKRAPGTGCAAILGYNRMHAIFGQTDEGPDSLHTCIAVHPSDMAVAMAAHEAVLHLEGPAGPRRLAFEDLHRLPGDAPERDTTLGQGELITALELPPFVGRSHYLKVRDRASYAYALVSCAVAVEQDADGRITTARLALGSVAAKPWRLRVAEELLIGELPSRELFAAAAGRALRGARSYPMNAYKPGLGRTLVQRALLEVTGLEPLAGPAGTVFASSVGGIAGLEGPA